MSISFGHASDTLVNLDFGDFSDWVYKHDVNCSAGTVAEINRLLGTNFDNQEGGFVEVEELQPLIETCSRWLESADEEDRLSLYGIRINQLRELAKSALEYNEPITYG